MTQVVMRQVEISPDLGISLQALHDETYECVYIMINNVHIIIMWASYLHLEGPILNESHYIPRSPATFDLALTPSPLKMRQAVHATAVQRSGLEHHLCSWL